MPDAAAPVPEPLEVTELQQRILAAVEPLGHFPQPLMETLGLAAAEDVHAPIPLPTFDNSSMDGYAVVAADVAGATEESPIHLPVVGEIGAGRAQILAMSPGTAVKIMTGAPVPSGADAVVPYEWTDRGVAHVRITDAPEPAQHIRRAGDDIAEGDLLVQHGTVLGPRHLGLLAAVGRPTIQSRPRPRVVIISTGTELREAGSSLGHDGIYDGNSFLLAGAVRAAGGIAYRVGIVPDEPRAFLDALSDQLVRADMVITSGGVSQGDFDVVKEALSPLGTVWFGPVAMQPGKPQGFGHVGEDQVPIFTLPGNPVSSYVSFQVFVLPALRKMMGKEPYIRPAVRARLTREIRSPRGREQYVRATHDPADNSVTPVGGHGSHLMGDLAHADSLIVVPAAQSVVPSGQAVDVLRLDADF